MKTMAISEFKTHALKVIDEISKTREPVVITKRGKPVCRVVPCSKRAVKLSPGRLADAFVFEKDIVTPLDEELWEACR